MLLIFLFVCFGGLAFMFFNIQKMQEKTLQTIQEEHARLSTVLRALEARLDTLEGQSEPGEDRSVPPRSSSVSSSSLEEEPLMLLKGSTVAQAAELLRQSEPLKAMNLRLDESGSSRRSQRKDGSMPEIKL